MHDIKLSLCSLSRPLTCLLLLSRLFPQPLPLPSSSYRHLQAMAISLTPFAPDPGYEHTTGFYPKGRPQGEMLIILPHVECEGGRRREEGRKGTE